MPIFALTITTKIVVEADDEADAIRVATDELNDIQRCEEPCIEVDDQVRSLSGLSDGWDEMCLPYGGDGKTRLKDLLPPNAQGERQSGNGNNDGRG